MYTQYAFNDVKFGGADVLARAKNISIEGIADKGALTAQKGIVRLRTREELANVKLSIVPMTWLLTQQLTHALETGSVEECAKIAKDCVVAAADCAKALACRLFTIADKKHWQKEAFAYNSLVTSWGEAQTRAAQLSAETPVQDVLFD